MRVETFQKVPRRVALRDLSPGECFVYTDEEGEDGFGMRIVTPGGCSQNLVWAVDVRTGDPLNSLFLREVTPIGMKAVVL